MEKLTVEKSMESVDNNLAKYQELMGKLAVFQERLRKAEEERRSVKNDIFDKVCAEYEEELKKLENEIKPIRGEMRKARDILSKKLSEIEALSKELQDKIDELAFRHRIGEFVDNELSSRAAPLKEQWEELAKRKSDLTDKLRQFSFAAEDPAGSEQPNEQETEIEVEITSAPKKKPEIKAEPSAEAKPKAKAKPAPAPEPEIEIEIETDDPKIEYEIEIESGPEPEPEPPAPPKSRSKPSGNGETAQEKKKTDKKSAKKTKDEKSDNKKTDDDLVNPVEWMKEFEANGQSEGGAPAKQKTHSPKAKADAKAAVESLTDLADPTDDAPVKVKTEKSDVAPSKAFPILVITAGPGVGKKFPVVPMTMTVGREHDNNIELKDEEVARYHARILYQNGHYTLQNLESSPGTWLNDEEIKEAALKHGDKIRVGNTELLIDFS